MTDASFLDRRDLLRVLGAGLVAGAAEPALAGVASAPGITLPDRWSQAGTLPLWNGEMPGGGAFAATPFPPGFPATMVHGIARPELRVFRPARPNGAAALVMPGGGYAIVSILNEGLEIADRFTAAGYTVFVLVYRLPGEGWRDHADVPLQDAQRAMRLIRAHAAHYGLDPARTAAIGFSAGGHLCASLATGFAEPLYEPRDPADRLDARPAAAGLIYPVITLTAPYAHRGSARLLLGADADAAAVARRSPEQHVAADTPPLFLAHAVDDPVVPMQNSILMLEAMKAARRPVEAHFFPVGGHGFGLAKPGSRAAEWPALFLGWLADALAHP